MGAGELQRVWVMVFCGKRGENTAHNHASSLPQSLCSRHRQQLSVHQRASALNISHHTAQKARYSRLECTAADQSVLRGEWGIVRVAASLCGRLASLQLFFDPNGAQSGVVRLGRTGAGAKWTERVVAAAAESVIQRGGGERPRLVIPAERARAEVTERRGWGATHAAVVPRTLPSPCEQKERSL